MNLRKVFSTSLSALLALVLVITALPVFAAPLSPLPSSNPIVDRGITITAPVSFGAGTTQGTIKTNDKTVTISGNAWETINGKVQTIAEAYTLIGNTKTPLSLLGNGAFTGTVDISNATVSQPVYIYAETSFNTKLSFKLAVEPENVGIFITSPVNYASGASATANNQSTPLVVNGDSVTIAGHVTPAAGRTITEIAVDYGKRQTIALNADGTFAVTITISDIALGAFGEKSPVMFSTQDNNFTRYVFNLYIK
jgi:hypothetical protein